MAQTADSQPSQTSHVELDQTTPERLRKLPMQLNTSNIFVPALVRVSPNASVALSQHLRIISGAVVCQFSADGDSHRAKHLRRTAM